MVVVVVVVVVVDGVMMIGIMGSIGRIGRICIFGTFGKIGSFGTLGGNGRIGSFGTLSGNGFANGLAGIFAVASLLSVVVETASWIHTECVCLLERYTELWLRLSCLLLALARLLRSSVVRNI